MVIIKFKLIIPQGVFTLSKAFHHNGGRQEHERKEPWASHLNLFYLNFVTLQLG